MRKAYNILARKPQGKSHIEDLAIGGCIISKGTFMKLDKKWELHPSDSGQDHMMVFHEYTSTFYKYGIKLLAR
jgi:hypothetical protein